MLKTLTFGIHNESSDGLVGNIKLPYQPEDGHSRTKMVYESRWVEEEKGIENEVIN